MKQKLVTNMEQTDDKIQEFIYNTSNAQVSARGPGLSGATTSALRPSGSDMQKSKLTKEEEKKVPFLN